MSISMVGIDTYYLILSIINKLHRKQFCANMKKIM